MATNLRSTVVGVFGNRASAEQAVQALEDTGFGHDQIWYSSPGGASSFFEDIKSLFTGTGTVSDNLVNALTDMGLSDEEARYYANEYRSGHSVVAVRAPDREQEAMALLKMYGAFHYNVAGVYKDSATSSPADTTLEEQPTSSYAPHEADSVPEAASTPPMESTMESASTTLTPQEPAYESQEVATATDEPAHPIEEDYPRPVYESLEVAPATDEPVHPIEKDYPQEAQADVTTEQAEVHVLEESTPVPVTTEPADYEAPSLLEMQPNSTPLEPALEDVPQATEPTAATMEPVDHETRMQEMLRQIQEVQRQLGEVQAQLQAAKEREAQLRTAKERESQFKDAQKRLQDLQDELRATLDELRRTEESVAQLGGVILV
jgi:Heat induced stress protein YflT